MHALTSSMPPRPALAGLRFGMSFPRDAVARIYRPARSPLTAGRAGTRRWRLEFERRSAPFAEPLMGWFGGDDPLAHLALSFDTREAAIAFARRAGIRCVVIDPPPADRASPAVARAAPPAVPDASSAEDRAANDVIAAYLSLALSQARYGAIDPPPRDIERALLSPADVFAAPQEVLDDPALSNAAKREILRRWAWDEYLAEASSTEAMPEGSTPSRLDEVKRALMALDERERGKVWFLAGIAPKESRP